MKEMGTIKLYQVLLGVFLIGGVSSCVTSSKVQKITCTANVIEANGRPCWVNVSPKKGIVVNMAKHIKPEKTRGILFKSALAELAVSKNGVGVAQDAIVKKVVKEYNNSYSKKTSMTSLAVITTAKDSIEIKASVKAVWSDHATQKLYMWVILEDH
jgi:hypothetical protein